MENNNQEEDTIQLLIALKKEISDLKISIQNKKTIKPSFFKFENHGDFVIDISTIKLIEKRKTGKGEFSITIYDKERTMNVFYNTDTLKNNITSLSFIEQRNEDFDALAEALIQYSKIEKKQSTIQGNILSI